MIVQRGSIYQLKAPKNAQGHEQDGKRFAVVVQNDDVLRSTLIVAPTSKSAQPASIRPEIEIDGETTRVMVEQIATIDPQRRLGRQAGYLSLAEMQAVDAALRIVLGL